MEQYECPSEEELKEEQKLSNTEKIRVYAVEGYTGAPKFGVYIGDKEYVLDREHVLGLLEKQITEKGYHVEQSKRQKYPRLFIND